MSDMTMNEAVDVIRKRLQTFVNATEVSGQYVSFELNLHGISDSGGLYCAGAKDETQEGGKHSSRVKTGAKKDEIIDVETLFQSLVGAASLVKMELDAAEAGETTEEVEDGD